MPLLYHRKGGRSREDIDTKQTFFAFLLPIDGVLELTGAKAAVGIRDARRGELAQDGGDLKPFVPCMI